MRIETFRAVVYLISFQISFFCVSQQAVTTNELDLEGDLMAWYDQQAGLENTSLYIGTLAVPKQKAQVSHPFYKSGVWTTEELVYRDQHFEDIQVLYDIHEDQLYFKNTTDARYASQPIVPIQHQVNKFTILEDEFQYISDQVVGQSPGYFHILYKGTDVILIAKRTKIVKVGGTASGLSEYRNIDKYYLKLNGEYFRILKKSTFLNLFEAHKREVRKFIRKNKIKVLKEGHDSDLKKLIKYCEQISTI